MGYRNELVATPVVDGGGGSAAKPLPQLDDVRIAAACGASWDAMRGDDRVRHCGGCDKRVYNLSEMTRDEAQALLIATEGKLCARYYKRADGTILTRDCAVGVTRRRKLRVLAVAGAALMATGAAAAAAGDVMRGSDAPEQVVPVVEVPVSDPEPMAIIIHIDLPVIPHIDEAVTMGVVSIEPIERVPSSGPGKR